MPQKKQQANTNTILRFSGMAFQMALTIGAAIWLGRYIDQRLQFNKPWATLGLALVGVILALYNVIKDLNRLNQK
jgi:F0F1-type ATP synthase assembly protein I